MKKKISTMDKVKLDYEQKLLTQEEDKGDNADQKKIEICKRNVGIYLNRITSNK